MDFSSLKNNAVESLKTTTGLFNAIKRLFWLYRVSPGKMKIRFKYPEPIGKIRLELRNNKGSDAFVISEVFQNQCYLVSSDNEITNILDLGANAGFTAVYFSKLFKNAQIACVEPMPGNISVLKENLKLNNVNAVVFDAAVTTADSEITMDVGDKDYGGKVQHIPFGKEMSNDTLIVKGVSVNSILKKLNWSKIDLVKIDIEGYEGVILNENNGWLAVVNTIVMEIHEGITIDDVRKATHPYGFTFSQLYKGNWILSKKEIV
jgi:FkbM family methyltransferase